MTEMDARARIKERPARKRSRSKRDIRGNATPTNIIKHCWTHLTELITGDRAEWNLNSRLHQACTVGDLLAARQLLQLGANPNARFPANLRTRTEVIREKENDILAVPNQFTEGGYLKNPGWNATSLFVACEKEDLSLVETLLEFGADPDMLCERRNTFCWGKVLKTVKNFRKTDTGSPKKSSSPLVTACCLGNVALVEKLLLAGVSSHLPDQCKRTALGCDQLYMCEDGSPTYKAKQIIDLLVEHGADINISCNAHALTPVQLACKFGNFEMTKCLVDQGAVIIEQGSQSCLHYACINGSPMLLDFLLDRDTRPGPTEVFSFPPSEQGRAVCSVLASRGYPELVLEWALRNMQLQFLSYLLEMSVYMEPKLLRLAAIMDKNTAAKSWILLARAGMQGQHALDALSKYSDLQDSLPILEFCESLHPHFIFKHTEIDVRALVANNPSHLKLVSTPESEEVTPPTVVFESPPFLTALCVTEIRRHLVKLSQGQSILPQIGQLPLPRLLISDLRLDHILDGIDFLDKPLPERSSSMPSVHSNDQQFKAVVSPDTFVICAMVFLGFMVLLHHVSRYYHLGGWQFMT